MEKALSNFGTIQVFFVKNNGFVYKGQCILEFSSNLSNLQTLVTSPIWTELQTFLKINSFLIRLPNNPALALIPLKPKNSSLFQELSANLIFKTPTYLDLSLEKKDAFFYMNEDFSPCLNFSKVKYLISAENLKPPKGFKGAFLLNSSYLKEQDPQAGLFSGLYINPNVSVDDLLFWKNTATSFKFKNYTPVIQSPLPSKENSHDPLSLD